MSFRIKENYFHSCENFAAIFLHIIVFETIVLIKTDFDVMMLFKVDFNHVKLNFNTLTSMKFKF